jgi:trimeric autotransporter adhesin
MKKYIVLIGLLWITYESWAQNTYYGSYAGYKSKGTNNSFFGDGAGQESDANGSYFIGYNSFFGMSAGYKNSGQQNTFVGQAAGSRNSGDDNVFVGNVAGYTNKGNANVFIGSKAAFYNEGSNNIFIGFYSGQSNIYGHSNFFAGTYTGHKNQDGKDNVFLGFQSGKNNYSGDGNTFLGKESGLNNTNGNDNLFAGHKSGYTNRTGIQNVFLGYYSGYYNNYGVRNTFVGPLAGYKNISGDRNVFIGYQAGYNEEGDDKLYISNSSTSPLLYGDLQRKKLVVGGKTDSEYTLHILGEAFSTGNWVSSDQRYKKDIKTIESAAEKILALEGKSYAFKGNASTKNDSSVARLAFHEGRQFGFLAQEMKEVLPELVREDEDGYLAVNYDGIIPVLVEAFKELKGTNEKLEEKINRLQQEIAQLSGKEGAYAPGKQGPPDFNNIIEPSVILHQNFPNPFDQSTEIRYEVAVDARQVNLYVYDLKGTEIAKFTHLPAGKGSVKIAAFQFETGTYLYSLIADGKVQDTKRMIVTP